MKQNGNAQDTDKTHGKKKDTARPICFVISPIGDEGTEVRHRADLVLNYVLAPALDQCGYEPVRADKIAAPGIITSQVIQHILDDPLVIADLSGHNPNVFYELALRHAIRRPVVQIIAAGEPIPFDVRSSRTIQLDYRDLESVHLCKAELVAQIKAVEADPSLVDNPISTTIDVQRLKDSGNPSDEAMGQILSMLQDLQSRIPTRTPKLTVDLDRLLTEAADRASDSRPTSMSARLADLLDSDREQRQASLKKDRTDETS